MVDAATWSRFHRDSDGDGHGDTSRYVDQCDAPAGYVATAHDCDDTTASRSPDEAEVCDAADVDEGTDALVFGLYLANVGDLDGDGRDDLWDGGSTGYGQVTFGGDTGATPKTAYDYRIRGFGAAGGRLDGASGTGDLAVGYPTASTNTGEASLYSGTSTTAYATLTGETTGDYAGEVLASADVDGDGREDVVVGASLADDGAATATGACYIVTGVTGGTS